MQKTQYSVILISICIPGWNKVENQQQQNLICQQSFFDSFKMNLKLFFMFSLLKIISANYTVTIMNDNELLDLQGFVHTWLRFDKDEQQSPEFFSFGNNNGKYHFFSEKITKLCFWFFHFVIAKLSHFIDSKPVFPEFTPGVCETDKNKLTKRTASQFRVISIDENQYNTLIQKSNEFCQFPTLYTLIPNDTIKFNTIKETNNCVTASDKILESVGITLLQNAKTPLDVASILGLNTPTENAFNILKKASLPAIQTVRNSINVAGERNNRKASITSAIFSQSFGGHFNRRRVIRRKNLNRHH